MTTDSLAGEALVTEILGTCDHVLGEIGRRRHIFGWLRLPSAAADEWLVVDAYYPGNRLVVAVSGEHDSLLCDRVPEHGLRLLLLSPAEIGEDPAGVPSALGRRIAELPAVARPSGQLPRPAAPRESPVARALVAMTQPAERPRPARRQARALEPERPELPIAAGLLLGIALVAVLCAEIYLGMAEVALGAGTVVLAFGIALDACSRVMGTIGAQRAGERSWVWPCVVGGSPVVAMFALFQRSGPVSVEPAPLAGLLSMIAIVLILGALLATMLGI